MTTKSPSYQWYPKDAISSVRLTLLSLEEEGAYRRALDFCWLTGSLPADIKMLSRIIGKGCTPRIAAKVSSMFTHRDDLLVHDRLDAERSKQLSWREKSAKGGLRSAELMRANRHHEPDDTAPAIAAASPPVKNTTAPSAKKKTSTLLLSLHGAQVEEMMSGKYERLDKPAVMKKLDEEFPAGYEFCDDRHVFNAFKHTASAMLKSLSKPAAKKLFDPMSRMRKLN